MKWKKKIKKRKPRPVYISDKIGDIKTEICFAVVPILIKGYKVWFERYKKIYEYSKKMEKSYIQPYTEARSGFNIKGVTYELYETERWLLKNYEFYK